MATVTLTIDGRTLTVEKGTTVLQAALENGIEIPYYCYHPALGVDGSCRVCIVKIEKMPKLQTSCSTVCTDGMVVDTRAPEVVEARAGVFEFLLLNHPLDCPVCDKGGECPLQDFSYGFGPDASRTSFPRRVFDGEGVAGDVDFGPRLMLNRNRCILCTRCVRFMRDVAGDAQIGIVDRGNGSQIATFEERGVHSLLSGNLMDVCPVGAITTRDYRFKSRPWDNPVVVDTVCTRCPKGCAIQVWLRAKPEWAKGAQLARVTPRYDPDVNGFWMCDIGRFDYHWIEGDTRLRRPLVREGQALAETTWPSALARVAALGSPARARFLVSGHASLEELFLVRAIAAALGTDAGRSVSVDWSRSDKKQPAVAVFQVPPIDAPNLRGARDLGLLADRGDAGEPDLAALRADVEAGRVSALVVVDPGPDGSIGETGWIVDARRRGALAAIVVLGTVRTTLAEAADVVLPGAASFEKDACYVNDRGRVQAAARVVAPPGDAREDWLVLVDLAGALGVPLAFASAREVRAAIAADRAGFPGYETLPAMAFGRAALAPRWLHWSNPSERLKWDRLFKDAPPVKFGGEEPAPSGPESAEARDRR